ncbi:hypothetical protein EG829_12045, partial [bacterium]|nr:hypothetical protein [bacterium]
MKILVLSNTPWAEDNSFGNSFSNIFGGIDGLEIANIYCRYGAPDNTIVERYFQITEKSILANLKNPSVPTGRSFLAPQTDSESTPGSGRGIGLGEQPLGLREHERRWFDAARSTRWQVLYWVRDLIWKIGRWESPELRRFIDDFAPDLIFQPIYYSNYLSDIALFISGTTRAPMVGYVSDDVYT